MNRTTNADRMHDDLKEMGLTPLLGTQEICKRLKVSRQVVYEAIRTGRLKAFRRGGPRGQFVVRREDLAAWLVAYRAN